MKGTSMAVMSFCAEEILDRAIEIEKKAKEFYREAAAAMEDTTIQQFFEWFSVMEGEHERTFREIKEHLSEKEQEVEVNDPDSEMLFYLDTLKQIRPWEARLLTDEAGNALSTTEILRAALRAENETVMYYTFLYDYVPPDRGLDKVAAIIREERSHVEQLQNILDRIEGTGMGR